MCVCAWVCVCVCVRVCVCVCVCVCVFVGVCVSGGKLQGNVCGCRDFVACIGGADVALLPVSCKNGTKFVPGLHEIRTEFLQILYEFRPKVP